MKIFHLSDLHIGLKLLNRDLQEDQRWILSQIVSAVKERRPDAVVIAGDIYNQAVPSAEAVALFDDFVSQLHEASEKTVIMMISGNHDSAPRIDCYRRVLSGQNVHMIGMPPQKADEYIEKVTLQDEYGPVCFYLLPFVRPSMVREIIGTNEEDRACSYDEALHRLIEREHVDQSIRNVIVSHQFYLPAGKKAEDMERMDSEIRVVGNIDEVRSDMLEAFDYAALGHIHKPMKVGSEVIRYCGTPLAASVSEAGQEKGIIEVQLGSKGEAPQLQVLPLEPLRQVRILKGNLEQVISQPSEDYVTVILTDKEETDAFDMNERLRRAFPYLLEVRRENMRAADYSGEVSEEMITEPLDLCMQFMPDLSEAELDILKSVIETVTS